MAGQTFTSDATWTVPDNVTEVTFRVAGGQGESSSAAGNWRGGYGHEVTGTISVTGGDTFYINVGEDRGTGSGDQYLGGGASDVRGPNADQLSDQILVGAGGGGASNAGLAENAGRGGDAGLPDGEKGFHDGSNSGPEGGGGGTQTSGGIGSEPFGATSDGYGDDGSRWAGGQGGEDTNNNAYGGNGGQGYYGGGGGAAYFSDFQTAVYVGGGGGGSSYIDGSLTSISSGQASSAEVEVTYQAPPLAPTVSVDQTRDTEIDLVWTDEDQSSYNVYRAQSGGSQLSDYTQAGSTSSTSFTDDDSGAGLENGERYYYVVTGVSGGSESGASNEVNATTDLPGATGFTASNT
jgi:hypothetical protein